MNLYSEKGKEVNHYKLANKYIIIAPKSTHGIKEKLKSVLPVALLVAAGAGFIQFFSKGFGKLETYAAPKAGMLAERAVEEVEWMAMDSAPQVVEEAAKYPLYSNIALWFLIGAISAIIIYMIVDTIRSRKK